jgi:hypothetical protein
VIRSGDEAAPLAQVRVAQIQLEHGHPNLAFRLVATLDASTDAIRAEARDRFAPWFRRLLDHPDHGSPARLALERLA